MGGTNLYGYYVTTNTGSLVTNAAGGIVSSLNGPQTLANLQYTATYDPGQDRQVGCGMCHSGATRMAMLNDYAARQAGHINALDLPTANDAGSWGPTCAVCHDPHALHPSPIFANATNIVAGVSTNKYLALVGTNYIQLRNPVWSSNYYTLPTTADKRTNSMGYVYFMGTTFASFYNPNVNICGQCHNTRGARWDGRGFALITTNAVTGPATNVVYGTIPIYTYTYTTNQGVVSTRTNIVGYTRGYITNIVSGVTNTSVYAGLTMTTNGYGRPPHLSAQYNMLIASRSRIT